MASFATGTGIATVRGFVPVESIRRGDRVCTVLDGDTAEVVWVGHRRVDCLRHPDPSKVWPVRVVAHAFGRGMPTTDLLLSPDQGVYVDRVLIPIRLLVNDQTVRQELTDRVSYHAIELAQHDVLLANGMPAEAQLNPEDRVRFDHGSGVIALYPDFSSRAWGIRGCAPLVQTGPILTAVRKRLAADVLRRKRVRQAIFAPETRWPG